MGSNWKLTSGTPCRAMAKACPGRAGRRSVAIHKEHRPAEHRLLETTARLGLGPALEFADEARQQIGEGRARPPTSGAALHQLAAQHL